MLLSAVIWVGCPSKPPSSAESPAGLIRIGFTDPGSLDPAVGSGTVAEWIALNTFEGLYRPGAGVDPPKPALVKGDPSVSEDGLTWRFTLHSDRRWSDGTPVTAQDFVRGWRRVVHSQTASPRAPDLFLLANAEEIHKGTLPIEKLGVEARGDFVLRIQLAHPQPNLPEYSPIRFSAASPGRRTRRIWVHPNEWKSNGHYILHSWKPRQSMTLKRNPAYPVAHDGPESVFLRHLESPDFGVQLFEQGDLHLLPGVPSLEVQKRIRKKPPSRANPSTCHGAIFRMEANVLFINHTNDPCNRLDRESLVRGFCNGGPNRSQLHSVHPIRVGRVSGSHSQAPGHKAWTSIQGSRGFR